MPWLPGVQPDRSTSDLERALMTVEAVTAGVGAPNVLTSDEARKVVTNEGAAAEAYNTLPTAAAGIPFTAVVQSANGERWTAAAGDTIRMGDYVTAAASYIRSLTPGAVAFLVSINATEWIVLAYTGVWIINDAVLGEWTVQSGGQQVTVDDTTVEITAAGLFRIKDEGVASGKIAAAAVTASKLNAAHKEQTFFVPVEDLAAGADIAARLVFVLPRANTLQSVGILTQGAPAGVDDANTAVITIADAAANVIVTKTYNTGTQPPTSAYASLGALDATHKILAASEAVSIAVTQGAAADLPAFTLVITTIPTDA